MPSLSFTRFFAVVALAVGASNAAGLGLPAVDLGTSIHQASLNAEGGYYNFSNIPYAEPPLGQLRFSPPVARHTVNRTVDDGSNGRTCPQGNGAWLGVSIPFLLEYVANATASNTTSGDGASSGAPQSTLPASEDCLLLDVMAPRAVFDDGAKNLPVLVWIHGGGFASGWKSQADASGLVAHGVQNGKSGFVYVAINYRLGLFGFPPRTEAQTDIASNAGLLDQRLALDWVQTNIHLFGGDPNSVTVIAESAGASSVLLHLTAAGGVNGSSPFHQAIIQSPAVRPASDAALYAQLHQEFVGFSNVSSIQAARNLSTSQLQSINSGMIAAAPFATFTFGPNVDGAYIPNEPSLLLTNGNVDKTVSLIVAHNENEGLLFTDPRVQNQTAFEDLLSNLMPTIPAAKITTMATIVYPEDFSGAQPYQTETERVTLAISEGLVLCNAFGLDLAYGNKTRSYQFSVFPGIHAQDVSYTFFNGETVDTFNLPIQSAVVSTMQNIITDFVTTGFSNGSAATQIPVYNAHASILNITSSPTVSTDPGANSRCRFWLTGLFS